MMTRASGSGRLPDLDVAAGLDAAFRAAVRRSPDGVALITRSGSVSLQELADRVDALARELGQVSGAPVIIAPDDAVALAAGALAAVRVGCATVVADPRIGPVVLARLAERVDARAVVTQADARPRFLGPASRGATGAGERGEEQPDGRFRADAAAVWVPTSGTTGDPGLVGLTESGLLAMAVQAVSLDLLRVDDRIARLASHLGVGPLLTAVVLGLPYVSLDIRSHAPSQVLPWLERHGVTYLHLAPTLLRSVLPDAVRRGAPSSIRLVGSGGETLRWDDVTLIRRAVGREVSVLHTYSSTEAGVVTAAIIAPDEPTGVGPVPVGHPVPGRGLWIDAGDGTSAPVGQVGEIIVEGSFGTVTPRISTWADDCRRLRSGDLGALDVDGRLNLHGRAARDGKVGLFRVDLRAVEASIMTVTGVLDAVVHPIGAEGAPSRRLVAHVLLGTGANPSDEVLRRATSALSPAAVPQRFVRHRKPFPTLQSGKVDLTSLLGDF